MAILETIKTVATTVLESVKSNPVAFVGGAVGGSVLIYGGYKGYKYLRNRNKDAAITGLQTALAAQTPEVAQAIITKALAAETDQATTDNLLSLTRAEAETLGLFPEWAAALTTKLRAAKK